MVRSMDHEMSSFLLQEFLASVEHSTALERAQQEQQDALQEQIEAMRSSHASALEQAGQEKADLAQVTQTR